jgi:hypothetical protein
MKEDIIAMALEAGFYKFDDNGDELLLCDWEELKSFAALVRADEREAVCRIVTGLCISDNNAEEINQAIRARGQV